MKVLPEKEFRELATEQEFSCIELLTGFIDKETHEVVVPEGATTGIRLHELGHERLEHFPKRVAFYGKTEPWTAVVDDEIEAEIFSFETRGKKITPKVGMMALHELIHRGWPPFNALGLVIGRLRYFGIDVSYRGRIDMVNILRRTGYEGLEAWEEWE